MLWPNLKQDSLVFVGKCDTCQRFNIAKRGYHPLYPIMRNFLVIIWLLIWLVPCQQTDGIFRYMLILVDVALVSSICVRLSKTALEVARTLFKIFCDIGFPCILIGQWWRVQERVAS
jgi:hypothetical protein